MKKFLLFLMLFIGTNIVFASEFEAVLNDQQVFFSTQGWSKEANIDNSRVLTKKSQEGIGAYSQYLYSNGDIAFTLATDKEFIYQNKLITVKDDTLSFCQIINNDDEFVEIPLSLPEVQEVFADAEMIRMSLFCEDGKIWIHKPLFKKKKFLLINDTNNYYSGLHSKSKLEQDELVKGLINIHRYGIFTLKHYGKHDGELKIYVR